MKKLLKIIIILSVLSVFLSLFVVATGPVTECENPNAAFYQFNLLVPPKMVPNKTSYGLKDSYERFGLDDPWHRVGINGIMDTIKESYNQGGGENYEETSINDGIVNVYLNKSVGSFGFVGAARILCDIDITGVWGTTENHKFTTLINGKDFSAEEKAVFKYEGKENEVYVIEQSVDDKFRARREVRITWLTEYQFNKLKKEKTVEFDENKNKESKNI